MSEEVKKPAQNPLLREDVVQKRQQAVENLKAVDHLKSKDSKWNHVQELLQDVCATHTIANPGKQVPSKQLREELVEHVEYMYKGDHETRDLVLKAIPEARTIRKWVNKEGWTDAVWSKIRTDGLFTAARRVEMIDALHKRGVKNSDSAAKLWLTLSGDYSEKIDIKQDETVEKFREINKVLLKGKDLNDS